MKNKVLSIVVAFGLSLCSLILTLASVQVPSLKASIVESAPPIVINQQPPTNSYTWPMTTAVSLTYDQAISPTTVNTRTFVIHGMQTGILTKVYSVDGGMISLDPSLPFKPGELIQVSVTTGTISLSGERPVTPTVWQFTTAPKAGSAIFASEHYTVSNSPSIYEIDIVTGDFNDDGYLDVFAATYGNPTNEPNIVWFNNGNGMLVDSGQQLETSNSYYIETGDVDNDGDLDVLVTGSNTIIWLNDGNGYFSKGGFSANLQKISNLADLNGDGFLDFVSPNDSISMTVWLNDGHGEFISTQQISGVFGNNIRSLNLGDLDNDGDLDLVVGAIMTSSIWLNDGQSFFSRTSQYLSPTYGLALGDLNHDSYLDIFWAKHTYPYGQANEVWFNDGQAFFIDSQQRLGDGKSGSVILADLDNDDDLDAYVANGCCPGNYIDKIWLNDGMGIFTEGQNFDPGGTLVSDVGDIDNDNDIDIFVKLGFYYGPASFIVLLNQDTPIFGLQAENNSPTSIGGVTAFTATVVAGPVANYIWDFGDGSDGSGAMVSHIYPAVGVYTAVVTASNTISTVTATTNVTIINSGQIEGLTAINSSPTTLSHTTYLTAFISSGTNVSYTWDLGDGQGGSGTVISHVYPTMGMYTAVVTAANTLSSMTATTTVAITSTPPILPVYNLYLPLVTQSTTALSSSAPPLPVIDNRRPFPQLAYTHRQGYNAATMGH